MVTPVRVGGTRTGANREAGDLTPDRTARGAEQRGRTPSRILAPLAADVGQLRLPRKDHAVSAEDVPERLPHDVPVGTAPATRHQRSSNRPDAPPDAGKRPGGSRSAGYAASRPPHQDARATGSTLAGQSARPRPAAPSCSQERGSTASVLRPGLCQSRAHRAGHLFTARAGVPRVSSCQAPMVKICDRAMPTRGGRTIRAEPPCPGQSRVGCAPRSRGPSSRPGVDFEDRRLEASFPRWRLVGDLHLEG